MSLTLRILKFVIKLVIVLTAFFPIMSKVWAPISIQRFWGNYIISFAAELVFVVLVLFLFLPGLVANIRERRYVSLPLTTFLVLLIDLLVLNFYVSPAHFHVTKGRGPEIHIQSADSEIRFNKGFYGELAYYIIFRPELGPNRMWMCIRDGRAPDLTRNEDGSIGGNKTYRSNPSLIFKDFVFTRSEESCDETFDLWYLSLLPWRHRGGYFID